MTANHEHTPSIEEEIRHDFSERQSGAMNRAIARQNFDRMIAAAEQRGAIKALREARQAWYDHADQMTDMPSKYYPTVWLRNRADRIANQEGDDD